MHLKIPRVNNIKRHIFHYRGVLRIFHDWRIKQAQQGEIRSDRHRAQQTE